MLVFEQHLSLILELDQTFYTESIKCLLNILLIQLCPPELFEVEVCPWKILKVFSFFVQPYSVEQLQYTHAAVQQQLVGGMTTRRNRGSVGSLEGGRIFNDAIAWISQQKVRSSHLQDILS